MVKPAPTSKAPASKVPASKAGVSQAKAPASPAPEIAQRLAADPAFADAWASFPPSHHREWSRFVTEAKKAETRERRADQVVEQVQIKARAAAEAAAEPSETVTAL